MSEPANEIRQRVGDFERAIEINEGYDTGRARSSAKARFIVSGPLGAVLAEVHTGWYVPATRELGMELSGQTGCIDYHQVDPEGDECCYVEGALCRLETWFLGFDGFFDTLTEHGLDAAWGWLEAQYSERFIERDLSVVRDVQNRGGDK